MTLEKTILKRQKTRMAEGIFSDNSCIALCHSHWYWCCQQNNWRDASNSVNSPWPTILRAPPSVITSKQSCLWNGKHFVYSLRDMLIDELFNLTSLSQAVTEWVFLGWENIYLNNNISVALPTSKELSTTC